MHERIDNPDFFEARGNILVTRVVPLFLYNLGVYGVADLIEFHAVGDSGIILKGREGKWHPIPIEYKKV